MWKGEETSQPDVKGEKRFRLELFRMDVGEFRLVRFIVMPHQSSDDEMSFMR